MPQILACAEALGNEECLMVAEDSLWPSDLLTPQLVYNQLARRKKALCLAALMPPQKYEHILGDTDISAKAAAGSKCFLWQQRLLAECGRPLRRDRQELEHGCNLPEDGRAA